MLSREDFMTAKTEMCGSGSASADDNLLGMEIDFCAYMGEPAYAGEDPGLWQDMEVSRSEGAEWLIVGRARGRFLDADAIAAELSRIWETQLRYEYREAHTVTRTPDEVRLQAVTQTGPGGLWVTADVSVDLA